MGSKKKKVVNGGAQDVGPPRTGDAKTGRTLGSRKESLFCACPPNDPRSHLHVRKQDPSWLGNGLQGRGAPGQATQPLSWGEQLTLWSL